MEPSSTPSDKAESVTKSPDVVVVVVDSPVVVETSSLPLTSEPAKSKVLAVNGGSHATTSHQQMHQQNSQNAHNAQNYQSTLQTKTVAQVNVKPNSYMRKMSTMVEEESSDDLDNDCPNSHLDNDSDSPYEDRGRLLVYGSRHVARSRGNIIHGSADIFRDKSPPPPQRPSATRHHQQRTQQQQQQQQQRHCSRHPSMRSLKSSSTSDEHHCCPVPPLVS